MGADPANRGAALLQAGDAAGAIEAWRQFLFLHPGDAPTLYNLALAHSALGQISEARAALTEALAHRPNFAEAHNNLGNLDLAAGDPQSALRNFDAALALKKDFTLAWFNRGVALDRLGRIAQSAQAFAQAATYDTNFAAAHANLGRALHDMERRAEAAGAYDRAVALAPALLEARLNRAALNAEAGDFSRALADHNAVRERAPDNCENLAGLLHASQQICAWDDLDTLKNELLALVEAGGTAPPFVLAAIGAPGKLQTRNATRWAAKVAPLRGPRPAPRPRGTRIRLGYLSGDFHDHATAHLMAGLFEHHDRGAFTVHGYSYGPNDNSPMRRRLAAAFDDFTDLADFSHPAAASRIRADGIDILIDLKGYTAGARPQIPALRPAPVQINWLGFPGSMGVDFIDYVIADAILAPLTMQPGCVERIIHLPDCFQPNDRDRVIAPPTSRAAHGLPDSAFVFCCFNNAYKFTPQMFALWMRLLDAVPDSVLWLLDANPAARENLRRAAGINATRLIFAPRLPMAQHLARHALADLFLDTLPVNALTTASDALYAGLPVLTCLGDTVAGRGCASLLHAMAMAELIASFPDDYEKMALALALDKGKLRALRTRLEMARTTAPLFDVARFVRNLENCFRMMLQRE